MSNNVVEFETPEKRRQRQHLEDVESTREILRALGALAGELDARSETIASFTWGDTGLGYVDPSMLCDLAERITETANKARRIIEYVEADVDLDLEEGVS